MGKHDLAPIKADLMERHLNQLGAKLAELGIPLTVLTVDDYQQLPQVLLNFC